MTLLDRLINVSRELTTSVVGGSLRKPREAIWGTSYVPEIRGLVLMTGLSGSSSTEGVNAVY